MNTVPRRSARLSQLHQQPTSSTSTTSGSSQSSSTSSSAFPSPADEFAQQQEQARLHLQLQFLAAPAQFNAPLPSPSASDFNPFFGYLQTQQNLGSMPQQGQQTAQQSQQQYNRAGSDKTQQGAEHHNSFSSQSRPNPQPGDNPGQLPPDFLAEAARRAQMACLMRDLGDVTL